MCFKRDNRKRLSVYFLIAALAMVSFVFAEAAPGLAQPGSSGLAVQYYTNVFIRNINSFPSGSGQGGSPVTHIDHQFDKGPVFGSGVNRGVCVRLTGYINLSSSGRYEFQALSNDGVKVEIDGRVAVLDPDVHSDRLSPPGTLDITSPGWKRFDLKYFQRKGSAALKLYWKRPGASSFSIIPSSAYGH